MAISMPNRYQCLKDREGQSITRSELLLRSRIARADWLGVMAIISRGFSGRRRAADVKLPPGQYLTTDFPVLSAGPTPHIPLDQWEFTIDDGTDVLRRWDWKSFRDLPAETITADLHCVTRWSKLGTSWEGVSLDTMLADVKTDADYALVHSYGGYTTNLPVEDLINKQ